MQLRPYQSTAIKVALNALKNDPHGHWLIQMPTGMGKTVVFAQLVAQLNRPTLVLAHRTELLQQAASKLAAALPDGKTIDIIQRTEPNVNADVWVASVQTLARGKRLQAVKPGLIIVDEAHHSVAASYKKILDTFPGVPAFGFTATPTRTTRRERAALADTWLDIIYQYNVRQAIQDQWLAGILYYVVPTATSLNDVAIRGGDFAPAPLATAVNTVQRNNAITHKYAALGGGKCVVFCANVAHCNDMAAAFKAAGTPAHALVGTTPDNERAQLIKLLADTPKDSNLVVTTCMVLTEGWDCPDIRMLVMARPTKSELVYVQQLGRGLRRAANKTHVIAVDVVDIYKQKTCVSCLTALYQLQPDVRIDGDIEAALKDSPWLERVKRQRTRAAGLRDGVQEHQLLFTLPRELAQDTLRWTTPDGLHYIVNVAADTNIVLLSPGTTGVWRLHYSDTDATAATAAELLPLARRLASLHHADTRRLWDKTFVSATHTQAVDLRLAGYRGETGALSKDEATAIFRRCIATCGTATPEQQRLLEQYGYPGGAGINTYMAAQMIAALERRCAGV